MLGEMHLVASSQMCIFAPTTHIAALSKVSVVQTTGCLEYVKGKWLLLMTNWENEVMNLLMSVRAPRQALGGVARVWGVGASNLELQPPHPPPHSLPIPHPETPQLNKVSQVTSIHPCTVPGWEGGNKGEKIFVRLTT